MQSCINLSLCFLLSFSASFANAADAVNEDKSRNTVSGMEFNAGLNSDSLLQVFMVLIFIVFLIFALSIVLKKFNMLPGGSGKLIKIISGISLSSKDRLLLIQIGDEQVLISASPGNVRKIHTLATPIEIEADSSSPGSGKNNFAGLLNSVIKRQRP